MLVASLFLIKKKICYGDLFVYNHGIVFYIIINDVIKTFVDVLWFFTYL